MVRKVFDAREGRCLVSCFYRTGSDFSCSDEGGKVISENEGTDRANELMDETMSWPNAAK